MIRRVYNLAALVALVNALAAAGVGGYLVANGTLSRERVQRAVAVLRGLDEPKAAKQPEKPAKAPASVAVEPEPSSEKAVTDVRSPEDLEILRREADRLATEMEQRMALTAGMMLKITTQREELEQQREALRKEREQSAKRISPAALDSEGFRRQIEIFDGLAPKVAMEHLIALKDPDEAAMILSTLEARKANKIVESAKSGPQQQKMQDILQRVREIVPDAPKAKPAEQEP